MALFQVKFLKPQKMKIDQVRRELLRELELEGRDVEKLYSETTRTWKGDKPKFESITDVSQEDASVLTGPTGSDLAVNKFVWLDEGTRIRWAVMSGNWRSKTRPGRLKSGRGRGRVLVAGRRNMRKPRPGIKARGWTEMIQKRRKKPFTRRMIKAKNRGLDNLYG